MSTRRRASYAPYRGHVGMAASVVTLAGWDQLPASPLEDLERLEQLRLIEAHTIATFSVEGTSLSVDTPEQLDEARRRPTVRPIRDAQNKPCSLYLPSVVGCSADGRAFA